MIIAYTREFQKEFHRLSLRTKSLFRKQESIFKQNWKDSRLHTKKLKGDRLTFSFRITRLYRVLFIFTSPNNALFVTIGHRKDIYR